MIVHEVEQGTPEWLQLRLGIPTASAFMRILTPKTLKPSSQAEPYMMQLIAERLIGEPCNDAGSPWMDRGREQEAEARSWYELRYGVDVREVGFVTDDAGTVGCSPDGLVGEDGGVEIKCPSAPVHVGYANGTDHKYHLQIQGCLWVTERKWWDFVSYNPAIDPVVIRYERDEEVIERLKLVIFAFNAAMDDRMKGMHAEPVKPKLIGERCKVARPDGRDCMKPGAMEIEEGVWVCEGHAV